MLLKRSMVLAAGVLLFIVAFIIYFNVSHAQMEKRFRVERQNHGVDGAVLTAAEPPAPAAPPSTATAPALDTNTLIGPVPPSSPAPDATPAVGPTPTPAAPDPNSVPTPAPSSTMNYHKASRSPFFMLSSYRPSDGPQIQMASMQTTDAAPTVSTADTNAVPLVTVPPVPPVTVPTIPAVTIPTVTVPAPSGQVAPAPATAAPTAPVVASSITRPMAGEASVIVLLYHQFKPAGVSIPAKFQWTMNQDVFESEMKYIHDNGYHVVPMSDLLKFLKHQMTLPPGSVVITIDDGYKSAIDYAAPILKKYGYPWTFFIYPAFITTGEGPGAASWNDLLQLQAQGIDIECHSMTHPQLSRKGSKTPEAYDTWLTNETAGAKAILEQKMGKPITCFAYPYGDYNKQVEAKVIAAGFEAIFTVADNPVHSTTNLHSIGRYTITQGVEKNFPAYLRQSALALTKADPEPGTTITNPLPVITAVLAPMGAARIDPASIETSVRDFGVVRHDFDPQTNTLRLYLSRPLVSPIVLVNLRAKDAATGQIMVANWYFNYEPAAGATHPPIVPVGAAPSASTKTTVPAPAVRTAAVPTTSVPQPAASQAPDKNVVGTPLDAQQASQAQLH